jgi:hypothetical protein
MKHIFYFLLFSWLGSAVMAQSTLLSGSGTAGDPYLIQSLNDLKFLRDETNKAIGETSNYRGNNKHFKLTTDIDLSNENWAPIGVYTSAARIDNFQGVFDGNGHTISNLKIGTPSAASVRTTAGLFGTVRNGKIQNLSVLNAAVYQTTNTSSTVELRGAVLIGLAEATTVDNCKVSGIMNAKNITTNVKGFYIGGIIGEGKDINIYNTSAQVEVTGSALVGTAARAASAGGLVGRILQNATVGGSNIKNCYTSGTVTSESSATTGSAWSAIIAAGVVANFAGTNTVDKKTSLENCISTATTRAISTATGASTLNLIAAGLVGSVWENNNISNSIANNPVISIEYASSSTVSKYINRIYGNEPGSISSNYANSSTLLTDNGTTVTLSKGHDTDDGEDLDSNIPATLLNSYCTNTTAPSGYSWRYWTSLTATSNDNSKGTAGGSKTLFQNETTTVTATAVSGNKFIHWLNGSTIVSTSNDYTVNTGTNATIDLIARFAPIRTEALNSGTVIISTISDAPAADIQVNGGSLIINEPARINSLTIATGTTVDVTSTLTIDGELVLKAGKNDAPALKVDAAIVPTGDFRLEKTFDNNKWYFVSVPTDVNVDDIEQVSGTGTLGMLGTNWWIRYYDGASRASNEGSISNWKNVSAGSTLVANQGYIIGLDNLLTGDYVLSFPLSKNLLSSAESSRSVAVTNHGEGVAGANHVGWNLVGLPYFSKFNGANIGAAYLTFHNGSTYSQLENNTATTIYPYSAFFVQASSSGTGANLTFDLSGRQLVNTTVSNSIAEKAVIAVQQQSFTDKTTLIIDDTHDGNYSIGKDLEKWLVTGQDQPQVYTQLGGIRYAYNALSPANISALPLCIYSKNGGNLTIALQESSIAAGDELWLFDAENQNSVVLNEAGYTTSVAQGTSNNRFSLSLQRIGTSDNSGFHHHFSSHFDNHFLTLSNVEVGMLIRIMDVQGKTIKELIATSTSVRVDFSDYQHGIYILETITNSERRCSKISY